MTECACFTSALQVSDLLHRTETALASATFDHILNVTRQASAVCYQYATCPYCTDPSYFTLYVIILRKSTSCYNHLVHAIVGSGSSPGTASTTSGGSGSQGAYGTTRLRVGNFEVEAPLDDQTKLLILRTEVRRAVETAVLLESVVGHRGIKNSELAPDEAAVQYQRSVVAMAREEISNVERYLAMI